MTKNLFLRGSLILLLAIVFVETGCVTVQPGITRQMTGDSVVLAGEEIGKLACVPLHPEKVIVRSTYREKPSTVHYVAGRDFKVNKSGEIWRTPNSLIPDFKTNILFGRDDFNHANFSGYGNLPFFVYCDYTFKEVGAHERPRMAKGGEDLLDQAGLRPVRAKLKAGESVRIIAFGDSITAGGEASEPNLIYWNRWAEVLRQKYPKAKIEAINGATGGDTTVQGLQRLQDKVLSQHPDLVLIAFGMNDHNREGFGVPLDAFRKNLVELTSRIRTQTGAGIIMLSTFPPNPKWHFGSQNMEAYANATEQAAAETRCGFVDVYHLWQAMTARKKPEDVLANNINHPNDFGHGIYLRALEGLGL